MTEPTVEQNLQAIQQSKVFGRKISGIAAALLPYEPSGEIAEEAFVQHLQRTHEAGLANAVNMDTGYVNLLTQEERSSVLKLAREALGKDIPFYAGAFIEGIAGDPATLYRTQIEEITEIGAVPVLFQASALHGKTGEEKAKIYREACLDTPRALAFELSSVFAPFGEIWDDDTFRRILDIPSITGAKHSSLDRRTELRSIAMRNRFRPDFRVYTGNDLGIDMVEFGSDYLLGLATFCPAAFAARDHAWETSNPNYSRLNDALQFLGNVAFRAPVPAYKHSAAVFLHMSGFVPSSEPHPLCPRRPEWEFEILSDCASRIKLATEQPPVT